MSSEQIELEIQQQTALSRKLLSGSNQPCDDAKCADDINPINYVPQNQASKDQLEVWFQMTTRTSTRRRRKTSTLPQRRRSPSDIPAPPVFVNIEDINSDASNIEIDLSGIHEALAEIESSPGLPDGSSTCTVSAHITAWNSRSTRAQFSDLNGVEPLGEQLSGIFARMREPFVEDARDEFLDSDYDPSTDQFIRKQREDHVEALSSLFNGSGEAEVEADDEERCQQSCAPNTVEVLTSDTYGYDYDSDQFEEERAERVCLGSAGATLDRIAESVRKNQ